MITVPIETINHMTIIFIFKPTYQPDLQAISVQNQIGMASPVPYIHGLGRRKSVSAGQFLSYTHNCDYRPVSVY